MSRSDSSSALEAFLGSDKRPAGVISALFSQVNCDDNEATDFMTVRGLYEELIRNLVTRSVQQLLRENETSLEQSPVTVRKLNLLTITTTLVGHTDINNFLRTCTPAKWQTFLKQFKAHAQETFVHSFQAALSKTASFQRQEISQQSITDAVTKISMKYIETTNTCFHDTVASLREFK